MLRISKLHNNLLIRKRIQNIVKLEEIYVLSSNFTRISLLFIGFYFTYKLFN
jgi:hypothetical protein